jgi:protein-S-isoprenylcysteine O-methyltransferase Ste14
MTLPAPDRRHPLETRVPPPVVALVVGLGMWAADRVLPGRTPASGLRMLVACALYGLALLASVTAVMAFRRSRTTLDPHRPAKASELVARGIFRVSRNPMYLALAIALLGWAAQRGRAWLVLGPVAFVLYITRFQILSEERALADKFGPAYDAYRRTTRRWL